MKHKSFKSISLLTVVLLVVGMFSPAVAGVPAFSSMTYTLDADFDQGTLVNLNHAVSDQLQLDSEATPFEFIWVAASGRGTIIKIDTVTGEILGEYWSAPQNMAKNPSRTTVDGYGNVWAGNRDEYSGGKGSIVHIGLEENGQCVDRNGNDVIDTSTGLGDIKSWSNAGGVDSDGGVDTAEDECIIHYVRTTGTEMRTLAVDANNDIWAGGIGNTYHEKIDGDTGAIITDTQFAMGCGGYGGLIDGNGILWSASIPFNSYLLRYDPNTKSGNCILTNGTAYGLGIDTSGYIWVSNYGSDTVQKISPAGVILGTFPTFGSLETRGVAVTPADDNVWIANSGGGTVTRLNNAGELASIIPVGLYPTGVAVDALGKVWVTNMGSDNVMRINPSTNLVDLTVSLGGGASPYNYSDMTGSTLIAPPNIGTWTVILDSLVSGVEWHKINWTADTPGDSSLDVMLATSADGVTFGSAHAVTNGSDPYTAFGLSGQYLKIMVTFTRATTGESPVLYDLTVATNQPPQLGVDMTAVTVDEGALAENTGTVSDPDGDIVTLTGSIGMVTNNGDGTWSWSYQTTDGPSESQTVTIDADDGNGGNASITFDLFVDNVAPTVNIDSVLPTLLPIGAAVTAQGSFTDPGTTDTHTAAWNWGDGSSAGTVTQGAGSGSVNDTHTYTAAGIYEINLTVTDNDGESGDDTFQYIVVYDPSAGFVTGGGWIESPEGAYFVDPSLSGTANFGFVAKYKKGANVPEGQSEFKFQTGDLNFHSSAYDWLVVTGSNYAQFKGTGTINGLGAPNGSDYKFKIWAGDMTSPSGEDTFRIRIWWEEADVEYDVYDNGDNLVISGGSIVVHTGK